MIETTDGNVARLVERNGQKLTAAEDAAERERLQQILASPGDFIKHHKRDDATRTDSIQLVNQMPHAMIFSYVPGQPQLPTVPGRQIVIDFTPDKNYKTPETLDDLLTGIQGRMWIDAQSHRVVRIEGLVQGGRQLHLRNPGKDQQRRNDRSGADKRRRRPLGLFAPGHAPNHACRRKSSCAE